MSIPSGTCSLSLGHFILSWPPSFPLCHVYCRTDEWRVPSYPNTTHPQSQLNVHNSIYSIYHSLKSHYPCNTIPPLTWQYIYLGQPSPGIGELIWCKGIHIHSKVSLKYLWRSSLSWSMDIWFTLELSGIRNPDDAKKINSGTFKTLDASTLFAYKSNIYA
jgi:hypothetical protein